jgi:hypothetical protein
VLERDDQSRRPHQQDLRSNGVIPTRGTWGSHPVSP